MQFFETYSLYKPKTNGRSGYEHSTHETSLEVNEPKELEQKKPRKLKSAVWPYFKKIGRVEDGVEREICRGCKDPYKVGSTPGPLGKNYGTSHLKRHLLTCKKVKYRSLGQMFLDKQVKIQSRKIDQLISREKLVEAIIKHDLPYSFVEYDGIITWTNYVSPEVIMPSRNTSVVDVQKVYFKEKEKLRQVLAKIPNRVCLTSDCWTAGTSKGYLCLAAQFFVDNWKLVSKILNICRMIPPHTGVEFTVTIYDYLKEWGIDKKVFSITLYNATNNDGTQNILKGHLSLQQSLLCDGEFFHVRCSAHILNLMVQEGLKAANDALLRIRESVKYVKGSDSRMRKFEQCVKQVGISTNLGLRLDVATRWNSTYLMLESALQYEKAFSSLELINRNYSHCPTSDHWRRAEKICEFLEPFYEITNLISGSSYPTSNLYFMQVWKIECMLKENSHNPDEVIKEMASRMSKKFDKYWTIYSVVLSFGVIFDLRFRLQLLRCCYSKVDASSAQDKVETMKKKLYKLYDHYANNQIGATTSTVLCKPTEEGSKPKRRDCRLFDEFKKFESQSVCNAGKSELDLYLEELKLDYDKFHDLDVIKYWKENERKYLDLSVMARDVLSVPITTVASESKFSIGGRVLTKYRSCIHPENVQTLVTTRNWLHGFTPLNTDEDEVVKETISHVDSNVIDAPSPSGCVTTTTAMSHFAGQREITEAKVIKFIESTCQRFMWTGGVKITKKTFLAWDKVSSGVNKLLQWQGISRREMQWQEELDWSVVNARGRSPAATIFRMSLAATVHLILIKQNQRIFQAKQTPEQVITRMIVPDVYFYRGSMKKKLVSILVELNFYIYCFRP
ncbi:zinc finger BED domain-containing protein RICESLEEPER 2-like [Lycium barbarum]|uniref:zinc finger BED domain-containing protein RICESLEEPER 2-like n=1 Tax=Lycium barbarum TaxID=112863 RepID=UPI00293F19FD|nr:zinc finger BED domain-containing protein RICESLEEPER 2-like [Lycium barbarum]